MTGALLKQIEEIHARYVVEVLSRNLAVRDNRDYAQAKLQTIRDAFAGSDIVSSAGLLTVATAGSFGRLDACSESDLDDMPVADKGEQSDERSAEFDGWLTAECTKNGIARSNPKGIFRDIVSKAQVLKFAGDMEERYQDFSRRILLLLESTWLYEEANFKQLRADILHKYGEDVRGDPRKNFVFLLNDTIRYFRTICVNYQYTKESTEKGKWPIRNTKLRHSRVLMYYAMIAAIGSVSRYYEKDKVEVLARLLELEPLARMHVVYEISGDSAFFRLAQFYNAFLTILNKPEARAELRDLDYPQRYDSPVFAALKANSDGMSSELLRFFRARVGQWDERFFEYMIL